MTAKQTSFNRSKVDDNYLFSYQWLDQKDQPQHLAFSINKKALFGKFRNFKRYKAEIAEQHILHNIKKALTKQPLDSVQVNFEALDEQTIIQISGPDEQAIKQAKQDIAQLQESATKQYLTDTYYHQFELFDQSQGIKPDHARIADLSIVDLKPLKPLLLDKVSIKNIRNATNYTLGFVQTIPYADLESRVSSSGAGFNPPLKLLYENQGDCDSKVTLIAALLRGLMPRVKMVLVFLDQHALFGIQVKPQGNDIAIEHQGITYVLGEPTGPDLLSLGTLSVTSEAAIANGHYSVENYHAKANSAFNKSTDTAQNTTE